MLKHFLLFLILMLFFACTDDEKPIDEVVLTNPSEVFSINIGDINLYQVDTIKVSGVGSTRRLDTISWFLQEEVIDTIELSSSDQTNFIIERRLAKSEDSVFIPTNRYNLQLSPNQVIKTENNFDLLLLEFPCSEISQFSATQFIDENAFVDVDGIKMQAFKSWSNATVNFPDEGVLSVIYSNSDNRIEYRFSVITYDLGRGILRSEKGIFDSQCISSGEDCDNIPWLEKADKGYLETINWIRKIN